jgi:hypothetical protein
MKIVSSESDVVLPSLESQMQKRIEQLQEKEQMQPQSKESGTTE